MDRRIHVQGTARVYVKPDLIIITLDIITKDTHYENLLKIQNNKNNELRDIFTDLGFLESDLKTDTFNISTNYETEQDENGRYKKVFKGHKCSQKLSIKFNYSSERLSRILVKLSNNNVGAEFEVKFAINDQDQIRNQLLKEALKAAKDKATIMANAVDANLGKVVSINYDLDDFSYEHEPTLSVEDLLVNMSESEDENLNSFSMEPNDIEIKDTISILFEIVE